jgi:LAS superfamily LD-carboxypeptidase LdcB
MAGQIYAEFIKDLEGEYNVIEYGGTGGIGAELYLSVKGVLKWISKYPNMFSGTSQILKVDWESDKPIFTYSTVISCNLEKIYIRNDYLGTSKGTIDPKRENIGSFKPIKQFNAQKYSDLAQELEGEANVTVNPSIYPSIGNLNNVYVNVIYLSEILAKKSDNKDNKVTIREFLQTLCDGINKALGSLNDLQVITDVDGVEETLTIVDYQQKRIKNLAKQERPITTIQAQGLGTMLTSIQAQSSITPEIADMISIGAQAQEQTTGEEATSFSLLSKGLKDKIYPTKKIGEKTTLEEKEKALKAINERFKTAISTYTALVNNQQATGDEYGPIKIASTDQSNKENIAVELYKACLGKFTQTGQTSTAFIPIKLDLSLYGLAGIKIYQKFKLSNDVLPLSYKDNFEFIILGISHTVNAAKWETSISSLISLKDQKIEKESKTLAPFAIPLETVSGAYSPIRSTPASPAATSPTGPDFIPGDVDYSPILNPKPRKGIFGVDSPLVKSLKDKKLKNANLKVTDSTVLVPIIGGDGNFKARYGGYLLNPIAAAAWEKAYQELLNKGITLRVYSAYRDIQHQRAISRKSPKGSAKPGTSKHGWGTALDISPFNQMAKYVDGRKSTPAGNLDGRKTQFYFKVGTVMAKHGWYNPWAIADGEGSVDELWHWEYWGPVK